MKTFKQFNEGIKTIVGLGLAGYGAYNYFKNKGKQNQEQPNNKKTKVNNNDAKDFKQGLNFLKKRKDDLKKGKTPVIFGDPEGKMRNNPDYQDFFRK